MKKRATLLGQSVVLLGSSGSYSLLPLRTKPCRIVDKLADEWPWVFVIAQLLSDPMGQQIGVVNSEGV
jgi:hypothetical protein